MPLLNQKDERCTVKLCRTSQERNEYRWSKTMSLDALRRMRGVSGDSDAFTTLFDSLKV